MWGFLEPIELGSVSMDLSVGSQGVELESLLPTELPSQEWLHFPEPLEALKTQVSLTLP